jgi:hypothetical protein
VSADRIANERQPLVRGEVLPRDERGPGAGAKRASDVGERPHGVVEEHQSELADEEIERTGGEVVSLCIGDHELRVGDRCRPRSAPGQLHEGLRQVDADDAFGTGGRGQRRRARAAANVEHDPVRGGFGPFQQGSGEGFELTVVPDQRQRLTPHTQKPIDATQRQRPQPQLPNAPKTTTTEHHLQSLTNARTRVDTLAGSAERNPTGVLPGAIRG